jgi:hypothetical protein
MVNVFSFTLFGGEDKYCKGLLKNIAVIETSFPGWEVWVYCGEDIPEDILLELADHSCVRLLPTHQEGMINKFYRFFAIDTPEVEICIVRDADSRIYERDQACIHDFLQSEKVIHIIRDHPNHHHRMMAGMWGIKKQALFFLQTRIQELFESWKLTQPSGDFWSDTLFLCEIVYPKIALVSMIHDELHHFEPAEFKAPFSYPLVGTHFIGQVYEFGSQNQETCKYEYQKS